MIYRWPGFLAMVWLASPPLPWANCLSFSVFLCISQLTDGGWGVGEDPTHRNAKKPSPLWINFFRYSLPSLCWNVQRRHRLSLHIKLIPSNLPQQRPPIFNWRWRLCLLIMEIYFDLFSSSNFSFNVKGIVTRDEYFFVKDYNHR
jgi:hypothetical protein